MSVRHLFFDLDGTLTDSCEGIIRCVNHALRALGHPAEPDARVRAMIGQPLTIIFGAIVPAADDQAIDTAIASYRERFDRTGIFENALYPGVPDALARLQGAGCAMRVVTAKPHAAARRVLEHFAIDRFFRGVHGPELSDRGCDKAVLLRKALSESGAAPGGAMMIGDRVDDMAAAKANAIRAVGAGWGYGSPDELLASGAVYVAADMEGLVEFLLE